MTETGMCFWVLSNQRIQRRTFANDPAGPAHTAHIFDTSPESNTSQTHQTLKGWCGSSDEKAEDERPSKTKERR